ncbi:MAG: aminopeptidase P N-terminal domain-containing protein [bacterium]
MKPVQRFCFVFCILISTAVFCQEGVILFAQDFSPEEFAQRREKIYDAIGPGTLAVLQGAPSPMGYVRFRQTNEFYYVCGVEVPHAYILLDGQSRQARLYLPHRNASRERSEGKLLSAEDAELVKKLSGIESVYATELLGEHLARFARNSQKAVIYTPFSPAEGLAMSRDLALRGLNDAATDPWDCAASREGNFITHIRNRFPHFEIKNLTPVLDELRLIKSPAEIAMIRKATRLSGLALMEAMRSTAPGIYERELDAVAKFIFYRNGAQGDAYYSLVASASNAWYPHYHAGTRQMQSGDFLLMDYAPDFGFYMSDITRVWPVNGKFNNWQTELYDFYLACYQAILKAIHPGVRAAAIKQEAANEMAAILERTKFSKSYYHTAAKNFVQSYAASAQRMYASLGHWIGMATHDVGSHAGPLRPGMVFTIEPALRVPEEKIYLRLEDVIVITKSGIEILSDFVPMERKRIEKLMSEEGMLKSYSPVEFTNN